MGNCCTPQIEYLENIEYKQHIELKISERDRSGNFIGKCLVSFGLSSPIDQMFSLFSIPKTNIRASGCILPGMDPRGECEKECQDSYTFLSKDNTLIAVLFDGHGKDGRRVSLFCRDFMVKFFEKNYDNFELDPKASIFQMIENCDEDLACSGIECNLSGTTAVVVILNSLGIHAASVGDSRAVLASLPRDNNFPNQIVKSGPFKRPVRPVRNLANIALTVDQKPNHEEELKRITAAGGVVEKLADDLGHPIGPHRVWKKKGNLPGLAMSRSLGDRVAHEVGVSSIPIFHQFQFYPAFDQFIVLASDGVWDVMENSEVVNFIEKFKNNCQNSGNTYPAKVSNSTISRMLCEEARFRWFGIIEDEDVMVDDISCVVIELNSIESPDVWKGRKEDRKTSKFKSINIDLTVKNEAGKVVRKDPNRGSMTNDTEAIEAALEEMKI